MAPKMNQTMGWMPNTGVCPASAAMPMQIMTNPRITEPTFTFMLPPVWQLPLPPNHKSEQGRLQLTCRRSACLARLVIVSLEYAQEPLPNLIIPCIPRAGFLFAHAGLEGVLPGAL